LTVVLRHPGLQLFEAPTETPSPRLRDCAESLGGLNFYATLLEIFAVPGILAQRGSFDRVGIDDDHFFAGGLAAGAAQVERRGLQSVEQQAGGFVLDVTESSRCLTCIGASWMEFASSDTGRWSAPFLGLRRVGCGVDGDMLLAPALMKEAKLVAADGGQSALSAVDLGVPAWGAMFARQILDAK
jgi:hypothetical protein